MSSQRLDLIFSFVLKKYSLSSFLYLLKYTNVSHTEVQRISVNCGIFGITLCSQYEVNTGQECSLFVNDEISCLKSDSPSRKFPTMLWIAWRMQGNRAMPFTVCTESITLQLSEQYLSLLESILYSISILSRMLAISSAVAWSAFISLSAITKGSHFPSCKQYIVSPTYLRFFASSHSSIDGLVKSEFEIITLSSFFVAFAISTAFARNESEFNDAHILCKCKSSASEKGLQLNKRYFCSSFLMIFICSKVNVEPKLPLIRFITFLFLFAAEFCTDTWCVRSRCRVT